MGSKSLKIEPQNCEWLMDQVVENSLGTGALCFLRWGGREGDLDGTVTKGGEAGCGARGRGRVKKAPKLR